MRGRLRASGADDAFILQPCGLAPAMDACLDWLDRELKYAAERSRPIGSALPRLEALRPAVAKSLGVWIRQVDAGLASLHPRPARGQSPSASIQ